MDSDEDFVDDSPSPFPEGSEDYGIEFDKPDLLNKPSSHNRYYMEDEDFIHEVLNPEQIVEFMRSIIEEVAEIVRLPFTYCRVLLHYFRWDKSKMMEQYVTGDHEKLFKLAGLPSTAVGITSQTQGSSSAARSTQQWSRVPSNQSSSPQCEICCGSIYQLSMQGGACGHQFCSTCWNAYLTFKIMDEGVGQTLACPAYDCNVVLDDRFILKLVKDPNVKLRYQHLITNSFVETNRMLAWCPGKDCGRAIRVREYAARPVSCVCGTTFCFACHNQRHEPIRCNILKRWLKKCDDDSETSNWIAANTKECPRCHVTIEKDGGCNHMVCKNQACRHDFCWVCLGPWEPHGSSWYNCNRFNDDDAKRAREGQAKSRNALERYLHYCNRYGAHFNSMKHESKLYNMAQGKMDQLQQMNMSWIEVQFLKQAVDTLCRCRQTLMYTYAFAYYLCSNNQSAIFEGNQGDLERATEELSEYLERQIKLDELSTIKQKVQDKSRYCEARRRSLLEHVYEGYDNDWWEFSSS